MKKMFVLSFFLMFFGKCLQASEKIPEDKTVIITVSLSLEDSTGAIRFEPQNGSIDSIRIQRSKNGDVVFSGKVKNDQIDITSFVKEKKRQDRLSCCYWIVMITSKKEELLQMLYLH